MKVLEKAVEVDRLTTDQEKIDTVTRSITEHGNYLRERYPILLRQDALGASVMVFSLVGMVITGGLYIKGFIPAWLCIFINALLTSLIHEIEHDLIHRLYFRKKPLAHNAMMFFCWLARPGMPSPWLRRSLHFHHHKESGTDSDVEAWITTSGSPWGILRLLKLMDGFIFGFLNAIFAPGWRQKIKLLGKIIRLNTPFGLLYWGCWYVFLGYHATVWFGSIMGQEVHPSAATPGLIEIVNSAVVILIAPNLIRQFCLFFISSNMHYYGDVAARNPLQQTQVMNPWWLWPFQMFCFNFGSTHSIHHFVVRDPFYLRQMTAPHAHKVMAQAGVRFNDFGTYKRANRYSTKHAHTRSRG
ncbi:fatty acid desaturase [Pseudomonas sp. PA-6-1D]|uniref:fatty acid desaturase n=1 Tax=Pseudomonas TaxID=286 RepID=UPI001EF0ACD8|nr:MULTISPECIES: fatty acid desaturase [Pseudomonas]MCF5142042.1 fatty acid desaturase [Pseudomonas sp. PA-6-3C]MCF5145529.1 fatty acid desaturase [Pseudomonas sp. PA-6-3F]MCF5157367.1 fatty acid desaturase [Pseudomonas sp. PA-6-2E]MCF5175277.1 fatty acid desaturase [Pseudomonas sp. PA-6-1D]MCF5190545.1 fatty acid desaturase [Pseudomonas sp. PA-6-1H]